MRNFLLALIFVLVTAAKNGIAMKKFQMNCENIKCPTTENPVCVKLNYDGKKQKDLYIVAINECEINYAKCKPGIEAVIVPMKKCEHDFKTSKTVFTRKKRIKRQSTGLSEGNYNDAVYYSQKLAGQYIDNRQSAAENDDYDDEENIDNGDNKQKYYIKTQNIDDGDDGDDENNDYGDDSEYSTITMSTDHHGDKKQHYQGQNINNDEDYEKDSDNNNNNEETDAKLISPSLDEQEIGRDEDTIIAVDPDYDDTGENEVNFVEYKDSCPKECPAKQVMVCARCQHRIHRTFLSVCHLRMFSCQHPDEKLELVSRKPCMQSSPYLVDLPAVKAMLKDPDEEDKVLKFIHCRDKGRLERDPRCKFR